MPGSSETNPPEPPSENPKYLYQLLVEVVGEEEATKWEQKIGGRWIVSDAQAAQTLAIEIIASLVRRKNMGITLTTADLLNAFHIVLEATFDTANEPRQEFLQIMRGLGIALAEGKFRKDKNAGTDLYR
jgi:hypothetical protein